MIKWNCNFNNSNNNKNIELKTINAWSNPSGEWVIIMCLLLSLKRTQFKERKNKALAGKGFEWDLWEHCPFCFRLNAVGNV